MACPSKASAGADTIKTSRRPSTPQRAGNNPRIVVPGGESLQDQLIGINDVIGRGSRAVDGREDDPLVATSLAAASLSRCQQAIEEQ